MSKNENSICIIHFAKLSNREQKVENKTNNTIFLLISHPIFRITGR
jgi:hypothetical protein